MSEPVISTLLSATLPISLPPSNSGIIVTTTIDKNPRLYVPTITQIGVSPVLDKEINGVVLNVSWPAQLGVTQYNIFVSPTPTKRNFYKSVLLGTTTLEFNPEITIPSDVVWHFWVEAEFENGYKKFIQEEPSFLEENSAFTVSPLSKQSADFFILDAGEMKFYIEEMRRRSAAMLENDAEPFYLYLRRWLGVPCYECQTEGTGNGGQGIGMPVDFKTNEFFEAAATSASPEFQGNYNCESCFGTGIFGGYYPKIAINARYGEMPVRLINWTSKGVQIQQDVSSWTLWFPRMHEHDFLVRARTGERFRIKDIRHSAWRGISTWQSATFLAQPSSDVIYKVTDAKIQTAIDLSSVYDTARFSWSIFA